ncbi:ABC transporter permease subunit [Cocleimonas flava]|uniref:Amino acid ABC transporter membrane protein 1 (PAAT family) n=1 Tax=Cocleimonas flava TaxID=634765 RepID=A0A4R1EVQ8_9GAMM|nr:ABC transporter permease subunit [Cocleimonas flava]TCJ83208.1 amino acid ABC transporter membrane protein 1 (PAAT family) [Cocleimonas flava]
MKILVSQIKQSFNNISVSGLVGQMFVLGLIFYGSYFLLLTTQENLTARGIDSGFKFLNSEAGLPISDSLIEYSPAKSYGTAFLVGILNTLFVSFIAIIFATILGVIVGVGRTSKNWVISKVSAFFVETLRNIPLLLTLLFIYTVALGTLPRAKTPFNPIEGVFLSRRGLYLPDPIAHDGFGLVVAAFFAAIAIAYFFTKWAKKLQIRTGRALPKTLISLLVIIVLPLLVFFILGKPMSLEYAELKGFNFVGGIVLKPEFSALLLGLILYTAAYIGENVRSGLQSVPAGQIEAARALRVPKSVIIRKVLLPQALRVTIPATTNDYTSLVKNSSLAVAIGYPDMVSIGGTIIGQNGQAIEIIAMWMAVYMTINLIISALMNWLNSRVQIVER